MFEDDTLVSGAHIERIRDVCNEIIKRGLRISWSANARADLEDLDTLRLMKRSGCRMLCVGYEFGDQQMLNRVKKGTVLETMRRFSYAGRKAGISLHGCFMIGGPEETPESARNTVQFAKSLPIDTAQFSGICVYPGTEFYQWCKQRGFLIARDWPGWVDERREQRTILNYPQLSTGQINAFIDRGLKEFYLRPAQILRMLGNIRSWADLRTKWHGLRSFIDYFSQAK
jgi:radical SAM superfamily enzyme YgiQ (UPF0313 family)